MARKMLIANTLRGISEVHEVSIASVAIRLRIVFLEGSLCGK